MSVLVTLLELVFQGEGGRVVTDLEISTHDQPLTQLESLQDSFGRVEKDFCRNLFLKSVAQMSN